MNPLQLVDSLLVHIRNGLQSGYTPVPVINFLQKHLFQERRVKAEAVFLHASQLLDGIKQCRRLLRIGNACIKGLGIALCKVCPQLVKGLCCLITDTDCTDDVVAVLAPTVHQRGRLCLLGIIETYAAALQHTKNFFRVWIQLLAFLHMIQKPVNRRLCLFANHFHVRFFLYRHKLIQVGEHGSQFTIVTLHIVVSHQQLRHGFHIATLHLRAVCYLLLQTNQLTQVLHILF